FDTYEAGCKARKMITTNSTPFTMPVQPACNGGFGGSGMWGDGSWIFFILILLIFGWGNNGWGGYGSGGIQENYILTSDFSQLSKQISDTYNMTDRKFEGLANGMCSMGYETQGLINGVNTNIMQSANAMQSQMASCCCDLKQQIGDVKYTIGSTGAEISRGVERGFADTNYNLATNANMLDRTIADKFCQTNFNAQTNTRDVIDSQNANTRAILDKLCQMESNAKDEKIADLTAKNFDLRLAASQEAQNRLLINELGYQCPKPAYVVQPPQTVSFPIGCNGYANYTQNSCCGCGNVQ
ncbi:MAG: hypothetical protein MJ236_05225, partial [Clostridia bacterium]|nr:hypothetical protein [Clostridia bacterium]